LASFAGFFPAENPQIVGLITLEYPKGLFFGSQTAGPAFKNIAAKILSSKSRPFLTTRSSSREVDSFSQEGAFSLSMQEKPDALLPDVLGMTAREAMSLFSAKNIPFRIKGSGVVKSLIPEPGGGRGSSQFLIIQCEPR